MQDRKIATPEEFQQALQTHKLWAQMEKAFAHPLHTIFLLQIDGMKNRLIPSANWLMGNPITVKNKRFECEYKREEEKQTLLQFGQGMQTYILNGSTCRIVTFNISWLEGNNLETDKKMNRLFYLKLLWHFASFWEGKQNTKNKIYLALRSEVDNEKKMKFFTDILGRENFGFLFCGDEERNDSPTINNLTIDEYQTGKCQFSSQQLFSDAPRISFNLQKLFQRTNWEKKMSRQDLNELTKKMTTNAKKIYYLINPIKEILNSFSHNSPIHVEQCFDSISEDIHRSGVAKIDSVFRKKLAEWTGQQLEQSLSLYFFFQKIEQSYLKLLGENKKNTENLNNFGIFLEEIILILNTLPGSPSSRDLEIFYSLAQTLLKEIQIARQMIGANNISFIGFTVTQLRDIWNKTFIQKKTIIDRLTKEEIQKDADERYYDSMKELINFYYDPKEQPKDEEVKKGLQIIQFELNIDLQKSKSLISKNSGRNKKINTVKAIISMFNVWKNREIQYDIKFDKILEDCAFYLRKIDRPDLAIEFYKRLKHIYKTETCFQEILDLELNTTQRCQFYKNISKFYRSMNYHQLSRKYAQLACEQNLDIKYQMTEGQVKFQKGDEDEETIDFVIKMGKKLRQLEKQVSQQVQDGEDELKIMLTPRDKLPRLLAKIAKNL